MLARSGSDRSADHESCFCVMPPQKKLHTAACQFIVTNPSTLIPNRVCLPTGSRIIDLIFTLHEDAVWSDGRPITSEDIAFTMRVVCHPDYTGLLYLPLSYIEGAEEYKKLHSSKFADRNISGIRAIDKKTLQVTLKESYAPFLSMLSFAPLPAHVLAHVEVGQMETHMYPDFVPGPRACRVEAGLVCMPKQSCLFPENLTQITSTTIIPNAEVQRLNFGSVGSYTHGGEGGRYWNCKRIH